MFEKLGRIFLAKNATKQFKDPPISLNCFDNIYMNKNTTFFGWIHKYIVVFSELVKSKNIHLQFQVLENETILYTQSHKGEFKNNRLSITSTHDAGFNIHQTIITTSDNTTIHDYISHFSLEVYNLLLPYYDNNNKLVCELTDYTSIYYPSICITKEESKCCPLIQNTELLLEDIPDSLQNLCIGIYPNNLLYNNSRFIYNKRWNTFPHAIYYPRKIDDIMYLIKQFVEYNVDFAIRAGGHSYEPACLSSGYIIDISKMQKYMKISKNRKHVTISPDYKLGEVTVELAKHNLIASSGENACVGLAGLSLMGGKGQLSRLYGIACDNIVAIKMINYKGEVICVNETENVDLLWAIKGAGNGNFGIITEFTINVHENIYFYQNQYAWTWNKEEALVILQEYQKWYTQIQDIITSNLIMMYNNGNVSINIKVIKYSKIPLTEDAIFATLFNPSITSIQGYYDENVSNFVSGCKTSNQPFSKIKSSMIFEPIKTEGLLFLINSIERQIKNAYNILYELTFTQLGGAVKNGNSCYYPKNAISVISYFIEWTDSLQTAELIHFLTELYIQTEPYISFYCFPNLIDYDIVDYMKKYYGDNDNKLIQIKKKYDPYNIFHSRQSIPV